MKIILSSPLSFSVSQYLASLIMTAGSASLLIAHTAFLRYKILTGKNKSVPIVQMVTSSGVVEALGNAMLLAKISRMPEVPFRDLLLDRDCNLQRIRDKQ